MHRLLRTVLYSAAGRRTGVASSLRHYSAWISSATKSSGEAFPGDVERLFTHKDVQALLTRLCGLDVQGKIFAPRRTETSNTRERSKFALMTDERFEQVMGQMREEAKHFLQFVPLKEPRSESFEVLSHDPELANFDQSKFVFTDITFDATDQDRLVVVRETDGTLRTATPQEHDRMNRVYYEKPNRPINPPPVFSDPHLQDALNRDEHEFVMDWACWFYEPDDPDFVKLSCTVFDRTATADKLHVLYSTRHFGSLVFYLALNGRLPPVLNFFGADCIRLYKLLHPNWRLAVSSADTDRKVVDDYIAQNLRFKPELNDLLAFLHDGTVRRTMPGNQELDAGEEKSGRHTRHAVSIDTANVRTRDGPLGELSDEYEVTLKMSEGGTDEHTQPEAPASRNRGRRPWSGELHKDKPKSSPRNTKKHE